MPMINFGEKLPDTSAGPQTFKLQAKGQTVTLRFLAGGYYQSRHFLQQPDGSWEVPDCPRLSQGEDCIYCEQMFGLYKRRKVAEDNNDSTLAKQLSKEIRKVKPTTTFYFPALNRDTGEAVLFETTAGVRGMLEEQVELGVDMLNSDFIVKRNKDKSDNDPSNYYSLVRKDSSDTPALSEQEKQQIEMAETWDLEQMIDGKKSSMSLNKGDYEYSDGALDALFGGEEEQQEQ